MLQRTIITLYILVLAFGSYAQSLSDFKIEKIDKQVKDFPLDSINLSSPLDYYLSRTQVRLSGKYRNLKEISTSMFDFSADIPDEVIDDETVIIYLMRILIISSHTAILSLRL